MTGGRDLEGVLAERVAALTLEQKVRLVSGTGYWSVGPEPAAGLRRLVFSDGPAGVRGERWDERDTSANLPTPISVAATWNLPLVRELGHLLGAEARRKAVDVFLAPAVNLFRSPLGGRTFENYSEDPLLSGLVAAELVRGVQDQGVAATVKHFVANDSETDRYTVDAIVGDRALHELYLAPFKEVVEAGVWAVMAAYNAVNGEVMTESGLLRSVLRDAWGFDGVVVSDWFAVRTVTASANAALDLAMPGPATPWAAGLDDAVRSGAAPVAELDEKVLRILRLAARVGALDGVPAAVPAPVRTFDATRQRLLLRSAAADGMVLLRNAGPEPVLPLKREELTSLAVLGPAAQEPRTLGGGSATVYPTEVTTPLDALRQGVPPGTRVEHVPGVHIATRHALADWRLFTAPGGTRPGLLVDYLGADGVLLGSEARETSLLKWLGDFMPGVPRAAVDTIRVSGRLTAPVSGTYRIGCSGVGSFRLTTDGTVRLAERLALPAGTDPIEAQIRPPQRVSAVDLDAGEVVEVVLEHRVVQERPTTKVELNLDVPRGSEDAEIERAVEAARASQTAVVFVGTSAEIETESMDRPDLSLPGRQDELVRRVAAATPRTVVVVNAGAPVLMPWIDEVAAVVVGWFGGEQLGPAVADVLLGEREPGGRLPVSWPAVEGAGIPSTHPVDGRLAYDEGIGVGYRSARRRTANELFPFGHGLGYTQWAIDGPTVAEVTDGWRLAVPVANVGSRRGKQVVQVYAEAPQGGPERPARWLVGFGSIELDAGGRGVLEIEVARRRLAVYQGGSWSVPGGTYRLVVGTSLDDGAAGVEVKV